MSQRLVFLLIVICGILMVVGIMIYRPEWIMEPQNKSAAAAEVSIPKNYQVDAIWWDDSIGRAFSFHDPENGMLCYGIYSGGGVWCKEDK